MLARAQKVTAGYRHPASCSHVVLSTPQTLTGRLAALKIQDDCFSPAFQDRDIHPGEMSTIAQALKPLIRGYSDPGENVHACTINTVSQVCFPERRHKGAKTEPVAAALRPVSLQEALPVPVAGARASPTCSFGVALPLGKSLTRSHVLLSSTLCSLTLTSTHEVCF